MSKNTNRAADNIRILSAAMVEKSKSGHPGGAMGGADFINVLFTEFLNYDPSDREWAFRDRFFLDPGHMSPMLYSVLALSGTYSLEDLANFRQWGSATPGHPEVDFSRGVENTSGPLGQGHTMAVGAAVAERFMTQRFGDWMAHKTYTFISDGGIQEEISQGAGRIAGFLGLSNLIMFYDSNDIQLSTGTDAVTSENTAMKYEAWGWNTITINGNNADEIRQALTTANAETEKPTIIIGKTTMGKGCLTPDGENFERQCSTHGQPISAAGADFAKTVTNLGGDAEKPFSIFPETETLYADAHAKKATYVAGKKAEFATWSKNNAELAAKLELFLSGAAPELDYASIEQAANAATRGASATVLSHMADNVENMIVMSADLANSDKTDGFLKKTTAFAKGDFSGQFLQAGVCELTMACIANGMALHGGVIPACATFFVFSDYMKPALRLSALMELPVKYIWTHDAFRVGEDGPTHQPVEHEFQLRLMEKLQNHSHRNSTLVLRPADANETTVAWEMAMNNTNSPTGMIFTRQNVENLPNSSYAQAKKAEQGAYIVEQDENPQILLVASGSEVSTLAAGAKLLRERKGIKVQLVSAISEGLFKNQSAAYQEEVIPSALPVFAMTAGLPDTLRTLVGDKAKIWGLSSFGFSAPASVLDDKLGYNAENVYNQVIEML